MIRMSAAGEAIPTCQRAISRGIALFLCSQIQERPLAPIVVLNRIGMPGQHMIRFIHGIDDFSAIAQRNHPDVNSTRFLSPAPNLMRIPHCFLGGIQLRHPHRQFRRSASGLRKVRKRSAIHKQCFPEGIRDRLPSSQPTVGICNLCLGHWRIVFNIAQRWQAKRTPVAALPDLLQIRLIVRCHMR